MNMREQALLFRPDDLDVDELEEMLNEPDEMRFRETFWLWWGCIQDNGHN